MDGSAPFALDLPHGRCVGVPLPAPGVPWPGAVLAELHPGERTHAATLKPRRVSTWVGGRLALRRALADVGLDAPAVLADARGAPRLPPGVAASVSHKDALAVALVAPDAAAAVGVDVEVVAPGTLEIARMVLTPAEQDEVRALPEQDRRAAILLRFCAKEAIYKALDRFVQRYVGFQEVSARPGDDGTFAVGLHLDGGPAPYAAEARWLRRGDVLLTTARVWRA